MILPQCFEMVVRGVGSYCGVGRVGKRVCFFNMVVAPEVGSRSGSWW